MLSLIYILTELQSITAVTAKQVSRTGIKHGSFKMKYWFARLASQSEKEEKKKRMRNDFPRSAPEEKKTQHIL